MADSSSSVTPPAPAQNPVFKQLVDGKFTIIGPNLALSQADMPYAVPPGGATAPSTADVLIYADTITLSGTLQNPGRGIQIVARTVVVTAGATLDVSGAGAATDYVQGQPATQVDQSVGAAGTQGANGGDGGAAGSIAVYAAEVSGPALALLAKGAVGGRGQDGHSGLQGAAGQWGVTPPWAKGLSYGNGAGQRGGDMSYGGAGGQGGKGGSIAVSVVAGPPQALQSDISGGTSGAAGGYGAPGPGGSGAFSQDPRVPNPPGGPGGAPPSGPQPTPGGAGASGSVDIAASGKFGDAGLGAAMILPQLTMMQQDADSAFLAASSATDAVTQKQGYATAATLYNALMAMTFSAVGVTAPTADQQARAAIYAAAQCEMSRLKQGLNFFGDRPDWAPALTLAALQAEITAMLSLAGQLETSLAALTAANVSADQARKALQDAQTQSGSSLSSTQARINGINTQLKTFENSLDLQAAQISGQMGAVTALQSELQEEQFAADHPGCTAMGALETCGAIIGVGIAVDSGIGEIAAAGDALYESGTVMDAVKNGINLIQSVEAGYDTLKGGYDLVKGAIDPSSPDGGKVVTDEASYDAFIDGYIGKYAAAQDLKDAVHRYFDLVNTRNNNVLAFNALYLKWVRLTAEVAQQTASFELISAQLAAAGDPTDPAFIAYIQAAEAQTRLYLLRKIWEEFQAFEYWSVGNDDAGSTPIVLPTTYDLPTLTNAHLTISQGISDWQEAVGRPFDPITGLQISFTRAANPDAFAAMAASKPQRLLVRADINDPNANGAFANMTHVTAEFVRVRLPDYDATQTTGRLSANVVHGGSGAFLQMDGATVVAFSHAIRPALYEYDYVQKKVVAAGALGSQADGFIGLSPFTDWIIDLSLGNSFIDFETISSVVLEFDGVCLGPQLRAERRSMSS